MECKKCSLRFSNFFFLPKDKKNRTKRFWIFRKNQKLNTALTCSILTPHMQFNFPQLFPFKLPLPSFNFRGFWYYESFYRCDHDHEHCHHHHQEIAKVEYQIFLAVRRQARQTKFTITVDFLVSLRVVKYTCVLLTHVHASMMENSNPYFTTLFTRSSGYTKIKLNETYHCFQNTSSAYTIFYEKRFGREREREKKNRKMLGLSGYCC